GPRCWRGCRCLGRRASTRGQWTLLGWRFGGSLCSRFTCEGAADRRRVGRRAHLPPALGAERGGCYSLVVGNVCVRDRRQPSRRAVRSPLGASRLGGI